MLLFKIAFNQSTLKNTNTIGIKISDASGQPLAGATIQVFNNSNTNLLQTYLTDSAGAYTISSLSSGSYQLIISYTGYQSVTKQFNIPSDTNVIALNLSKSGTLKQVSIIATKPFVQYEQGKTLINVDAAASNTGTTVLEVLEKSPGVTVDRNGNVSLQGKANVQIYIDGKQNYLSGADLSNMLSSMSSAQVEQIELITSPAAKYEASGNAGIINIKTKKNKQEGFNGNLSLSAGQGRYSKTNNSLVLNYRRGKLNTFANLSANLNEYYTYVYALRKYYDDNNNLIATLDQPTYFTGTSNSQSLRGGVDYSISDRTTLGIGLTGLVFRRNGGSNAAATWLSKMGTVDSSITTTSESSNSFKNIAGNINFKHTLAKGHEITVNTDLLHYDLGFNQYFANHLSSDAVLSDASTGRIPSDIQIFSFKADQSINLGKSGKIESGFKQSDINTDNLADYTFFDGSTSNPDYSKSNHFLYNETITALYTSMQHQAGKLNAQLGVRYENTNYKANQLGNPLRQDSAFSRKYDGLFPSGLMSYEADSSSTFSLTAGRRIDRPAFQKLNPFIFIINKYTYQSGNPFFLPQFSWNMELTHQYKSFLTTTLSYSIIKDYFSQLFLQDDNGLLYYSEGNVGKAYIAGLAISAQVAPVKWWSLTTEATYNYKNLKSMVYNAISSSVNQLNLNLNNQIKLGKKYTGELSGFYLSRSRVDLQELLSPTGQISTAFSHSILKDKSVLKFSLRDIFYTVATEGNTTFKNATEYFIVKRDSRIATLGFTYRFGKSLKASNSQNGGANDEIDRVGTGN